MKIKILLNIFVATIGFLLVVGLMFTFLQLGKMNEDSHVVNLNGKLRALTFRLAQLSLERFYGVDTQDDVQQIMREYDQILNGLIHGDEQLNLPPAKSDRYREALIKVQEMWKQYKQIISQINEKPELVAELHGESKRLFSLANSATGIAAHVANQHLSDVKTTQTVLFLINGLVLLAILFVSMRKISLPLNVLKDKAIQIASGDYDTDIDTSSRDEIGDLARSFRSMVQTLKRKIHATNVIIESTIHAIEQSNLTATYQKILEGIRVLTNANATALTIVDPKTERPLDVRALHVPEEAVQELSRMDGTHPLLAPAFKLQQLREWRASSPEFPAEWRFQGVSHAWIVPLVFMNRTIACALIFHKQYNPEEDIRHHLELISKLAAAAISSKSTLNEVEEIRRYLEKEVSTILQIVEAFSQGNFAIEVAHQANDEEIARLYEGLNQMKSNLSNLILQLKSIGTTLSDASMDLSSRSEELARGSQEQASRTRDLSAAVEEMNATIIESARNSQESSDMAQKAFQVAHQGAHSIDRAIQQMRKISESVEKIQEMMTRLDSSAQHIGEIISVITDITEQTNLLALNAAIEAARAGEQGKGFAVVAGEVGKLAQKAADSTTEIKTIIDQIQSNTTRVVKAVKDSLKDAEEGIKIADVAGDSLQEIISVVENVKNMMQQLAVAGNEQATASEQISQNIEVINNITQESASEINEIARTADNLNSMVESLYESLNAFRVAEPKTAPAALRRQPQMNE